VKLGEEFSYAVFPRFDSDFFKVTVPGDGTLSVEHVKPVPGMTILLKFADASGKTIAEGSDVKSIAVKAGTYAVCLSDQWTKWPAGLQQGTAKLVWKKK